MGREETEMTERDKRDQRQSVRLDFSTDVIIRSLEEDKTIKGELVNLGIGGMAVSSRSLLEVGTNCHIAILIKDRYSQLVIKDVQGEVVRAQEGEMAVKFRHRFEWLALFHVYHSKSGHES